MKTNLLEALPAFLRDVARSRPELVKSAASAALDLDRLLVEFCENEGAQKNLDDVVGELFFFFSSFYGEVTKNGSICDCHSDFFKAPSQNSIANGQDLASGADAFLQLWIDEP